MRRYDKLAVKKIIGSQVRSTTAIVHSVDMNRVNITLGNTSTLVRGVEVLGDAKKIAPGSVVPLTWREGRPVVLQTVGETSVPSVTSQNAVGPSAGYPQTIFYEAIAGNFVGTKPGHYNDGNQWPGGGWILLSVVGDYVEYTFVLDSGVYTLTILTVKRNNYGIFQISLDGSFLVEQDMYASTTAYNTMLSYPITIQQGGVHKLHLEQTGKNGSSSGYQIMANWVEIR